MAINLAQSITRWWNTNLRFNAQQRSLLYEVLSAQLRAGVSPQHAFANVAEQIKISPEMTEAARAAVKAGFEGQGAVEGLEATGFFPPLDIGVLRIGDRTNTLVDAMGALQQQRQESLSIASKVVAPNLYYLFLVAVLLGFCSQIESILGSLGESADLANNTAFQMSVFLNTYWPALLAVVTALTAWVFIGRSIATGPARKLLAFFDADYRLRLALNFADFAAQLYRQGASHTEVIDAAESALASDHYTKRALAGVKQAYVQDGEAIETALADRIVLKEYATLINGMVPNGRRDLYAGAFESTAKVIRALLAHRYRLAASLLQTTALLSLFALIVILADGLLTTFTTQTG
jgi:type II secretory pathway component PulF